MKRILVFSVFILLLFKVEAQVDTTYIYNNNTPYGSLDIRIANSPTWYYYLQEGKTFSFRENNGVRTDTYLDMTSWDSSPYEQGNMREKNSTSDKFVMNYRFLKPLNYDANYSPGYPLVIIFHGLGEAGNCSEHKCHHADQSYNPNTNSPAAPADPELKLLSNDHQLAIGGNVHLTARNLAGEMLPNNPALPARAFPGFVIVPQNLNGYDVGSVQDALRIVRLFIKKYNVDERRIYIQGVSNGGNGAYEAIKRAPWMFSAAVMMSAIGDGNINAQKLASTIAHIPIWAFQGGQDKNPTPGKTASFIRQFRAAGASVRYTLYENLGHGTWGTAYKEPDYFTWLLGHVNSNIHVYADNPVICGDSPLQLSLPPGYASYQWQLNNQTIPNQTSSILQATTPGNYRARFSSVESPSEQQWTAWSNVVTVTNAEAQPQAEIIQQGTLLLRDLNDNNIATLESKANASHYYWYKDGQLLDLIGDQDDTVKVLNVPSSYGKGVYTLVTANFSNCRSEASFGKTIFFSNQAPINITKPGNFSATPTPSVGAQLSWTDASGNEEGFEIWRRAKNGNSFSPWQMAALTQANATTYTDQELLPLTLFQYTIRAVSSSGRSEYFSATPVEITTLADTEAPSVPLNFAIKNIGVGKIKATWSPSTDNSRVQRYYVYFGEDSVATTEADTSLVLSQLPLNQVNSFFVKAVDMSNNFSGPSNTRVGNTYVSGLYYEHSTGVTEQLSTTDWSNPEFTGTVPKFTLSIKTQEDYFRFYFDGFIYIEAGGGYEFRLTSNDGSNLNINGSMIVNNDGVHDLKTVKSSSIPLAQGAHRISVQFFDFIADDSLAVEYKGPDTNNEWSVVSDDVLKSAEQVISSIEEKSNSRKKLLFALYPNPTSHDKIYVQLNDTIINSTREFDVQVINMSGRSLFHEVVDVVHFIEGFNITPAEILSPGVYIVVIRQGNASGSQRLIIR